MRSRCRTTAPTAVPTVSLVSHDPSFCCDGRTVEINTSLESSWSTKLISIAFDLNRAMFDELQQVIDFEARSVNRFLQPGVSIYSSTIPYNIAVPDQNKKEIARAQNQINSADDDR